LRLREKLSDPEFWFRAGTSIAGDLLAVWALWLLTGHSPWRLLFCVWLLNCWRILNQPDPIGGSR
jgi:hypothetical protein